MPRTASSRTALDHDPAPPVADTRAFGALASLTRDHIYWFGTRGLLFTSPWVVTPSTERQTAVLLITASGRPFELSVGGRVDHHRAACIAPLTRRGLTAVDVGLVSVNIQPHHPCFGVLADLPSPGALRLTRCAFRRFDHDLVRAYEGRLSHRAAEDLFEGLVETAAAQLQRPVRHDDRAELLRALVRDNPTCSLGDLAEALNLSYTGTSHLFSRAVGLPFRTYQHWVKCMRATQEFQKSRKLTEIAQEAGFADSAHLSRTWQRRFGLTPSYIRDRSHVRIFD